MSLPNVERAIRTAQTHVAAFQPAPPRGLVNPRAPVNNHETSTRYMVVDPILRALGWDLADPRDCVVEYPVGRRGPFRARRVDYVLRCPTGEPAVVIEAKRIDVESDDERSLVQMDRYLEDIPTAVVAVVTNGQYWEIARRRAGVWQPESSRPLGIHYRKVDENARRLWEVLSKEAVVRECAQRRSGFGSTVRNRNRYGRRR